MRLWAAFWAAVLAWSIGKALGVPVWSWHGIGDRSDMALSAALLTIALMSPSKAHKGKSDV